MAASARGRRTPLVRVMAPRAKKFGHAYLQWAFSESEAAVLFLRQHAEAQKLLVRMEKKPGKGKALTVFAHKEARAVYDLLTRETVFELHKFRNSSGSRAAEPAASLDTQGDPPERLSLAP
jgi:hypothetical protein